jgi:hypothetical protein
VEPLLIDILHFLFDAAALRRTTRSRAKGKEGSGAEK